LLDELYCRDVLRQVPGMVKRTRDLKPLSLAGVSGEIFVYLREAANCYIRELPSAAVALARAAVEAQLREAASRRLGHNTVRKKGLRNLLENFRVQRLLTPEKRKLAHKVRMVANNVLHNNEPSNSSEALEVLEAARLVVLELRERAAKPT
jgi:hypothetical protein